MRISIVMPTYNGMKYLQQAIGSVLSQDHQDWELIISDDCSRDGTRDFLSTLRDPRIKVHFQNKNLGIFGNLNFLFTLVENNITQILCQDDYLIDHGSLDRLLREWAALGPEIAFMRCNHMLDANSKLARYATKVLPAIVNPEKSDLFFLIFGCIPGNLSNVSVRTEVVKNEGWFRPDLPYAADFEFWSRVGRSRPWAISKMKVAVIRFHNEQASKTLNPKGELIPQIRGILETLYRNLIAKGHSRELMRLMITLTYISLNRDVGVRAILKGRGSTYLKRVITDLDSADFSFGVFPGWLIYFACMGGRLFRIPVARCLLKDSPKHRV